jgi:hypothetical protein
MRGLGLLLDEARDAQIAKGGEGVENSKREGFVAQIVAQAVGLLVLGYAKEDWQGHIPPAQLA